MKIIGLLKELAECINLRQFLIPFCKMFSAFTIATLGFAQVASAAANTPWANAGVDLAAVAYNSKKDTYYFFYGDRYIRKQRGKRFERDSHNIANGFRGYPWGSSPPDAVLYSADADAYYFFKDWKYAKKPVGKSFSSGYPRKIDASNSGFKNYPPSLGQAHAVAYNQKTNKYYFYSASKNAYAMKKRGKGWAANYPRHWEASDSGFKGLAKSGFSGTGHTLRAAVYNADNDAYYFFSDNGYVKKPRGQSVQEAIKSYSASQSGFKFPKSHSRTVAQPAIQESSVYTEEPEYTEDASASGYEEMDD